jgi:hypothetical protein
MSESISNEEFVISDFWNREIRITFNRKEHIEVDHPEMKDMNSLIELTLKAPDEVRISNSDSNVELFYKRVNVPIVGSKYICLVIKNLRIDYFLITAYFTDKIKKGEVIWKKV